MCIPHKKTMHKTIIPTWSFTNCCYSWRK